MAKAKAARRRPYEYDHHYGLSTQTGSARKTTPVKAAKATKAAKKR